jgi:hypothetical protein
MNNQNTSFKPEIPFRLPHLGWRAQKGENHRGADLNLNLRYFRALRNICQSKATGHRVSKCLNPAVATWTALRLLAVNELGGRSGQKTERRKALVTAQAARPPIGGQVVRRQNAERHW